MQEHIDKSNTRNSLNIDDISVGMEVVDKSGSSKSIVRNKTNSSVEVLIPQKKKEGISSYQWLSVFDFNKRFKY